MARLILHIGMNKTGSTALQKALSVSAGDFIYPRLGEAPHHTDALVQLFSSLRRKSATVSNDEIVRRIAEAASRSDTVILSSEALSKHFTLDDVRSLGRLAERIFDSVRVVGYVREPSELISSSFWTKVKAARLARFVVKYQPYRPISAFDEVFGENNVSLWKYRSDVVEHFSQQFGLSLGISPRKNVTVSRPVASAVYRLNRTAGEGYSLAQSAIVDRFPHRCWPKFRLSPRVVALDPYDLEWVEKRLGCTLGEWMPQEHDVESERDLLEINPEALDVLRQIGDSLQGESRNLLLTAIA